jgi:SAM-dependent methyltransferase
MRPHWQDLRPGETFTGKAGDYARFRSAYPEQAVSRILLGLPGASELRVLDAGAGTGIFARQVAERGCRVTALEPNADMRSQAAAHERIAWVPNHVEDNGLPDGSFDVVTCAQAFHWMEPERALSEFHRLLGPGGRLALLWNVRVQDAPFEREYGRLLSELIPEDKRLAPPDRAEDTLADSRWFEEVQSCSFGHERRMSVEELVGRTLSLSYGPRGGDERAALQRSLSVLHAEHAGLDGKVYLGYVTELYLATATG